MLGQAMIFGVTLAMLVGLLLVVMISYYKVIWNVLYGIGYIIVCGLGGIAFGLLVVPTVIFVVCRDFLHLFTDEVHS